MGISNALASRRKWVWVGAEAVAVDASKGAYLRKNYWEWEYEETYHIHAMCTHVVCI